jgi:hypothetical protein
MQRRIIQFANKVHGMIPHIPKSFQKLKVTPDEVPTINLVGDPQESFYQLGLKDRDGYKLLKAHLIQLTLPIVPKNLNTPVLKFISYKMKNFTPGPHRSWLKSYAEGLGIGLSELLTLFHLPEVMVGYQRHKIPIPLGCSSVFFRDSIGPVHARVLDFPLLNSFNLNERILSYQFKDQPKIWSLGSAGLPFPALSTMNEHGLTLALHMKFCEHFNAKGTLIFEILFAVMTEAENVQQALKVLERFQTVCKWGYYLSDSSGAVLEVDHFGAEIEAKEFHVDNASFLYFNNMSLSLAPGEPPGYQEYCQSRKSIFETEMKKKKKREVKDIFQVLATPLAAKGDFFKLSPYTPSSIQTLAMRPSDGKAWIVPGPAPKTMEGALLSYTDLWHKPIVNIEKSRSKKIDLKLRKGYWHLAQTQSSLDWGQSSDAFHHIQMALVNFENYTEEYYARFFFLVMKSKSLKSQKELAITLTEWKRLLPNLDGILKDQAYLFIHRLEKLFGQKTTVLPDFIKNPKLQALYNKEQKIPGMLLKRLHCLQIPRIDIGDVFYLY